jgi:peptide/nickel transport system ATP-binding protein
MTAPLLAIEDLRIWFRQYDVGLRRRTVEPVRGMSVTVDAGEVVALIGASGAGKSLLAHAVLGLLPPNAGQSGTVRWNGVAVPARERARLAGKAVALLPQTLTALDPTATVISQVRRAAKLAGRPRSEAIAALHDVGLGPEVHRWYPHQLSGGMGRRVLTTIALMGNPELVIADEPTPGLAQDDVAEVLKRLRALADDGRGVLLITHDLDNALEVADRVVVCRHGKTIDEARAVDFTGDGECLRSPYTRALWQALPGNGFRLPAADPVPEVVPC